MPPRVFHVLDQLVPIDGMDESKLFTYKAGKYSVSHEMKEQFERDGYVIVQ